jgi:hypothetical protein
MGVFSYHEEDFYRAGQDSLLVAPTNSATSCSILQNTDCQFGLLTTKYTNHTKGERIDHREQLARVLLFLFLHLRHNLIPIYFSCSSCISWFNQSRIVTQRIEGFTQPVREPASWRRFLLATRRGSVPSDLPVREIVGPGFVLPRYLWSGCTVRASRRRSV